MGFFFLLQIHVTTPNWEQLGGLRHQISVVRGPQAGGWRQDMGTEARFQQRQFQTVYGYGQDGYDDDPLGLEESNEYQMPGGDEDHVMADGPGDSQGDVAPLPGTYSPTFSEEEDEDGDWDPTDEMEF